jgi:hypothetical protein
MPQGNGFLSVIKIPQFHGLLPLRILLKKSAVILMGLALYII